MSNNIVKNWIALADYDLDTADAILKTGRYLLDEQVNQRKTV